jgi:predicted hotdog family 3-hydroxylacyl-ACP dehydratase
MSSAIESLIPHRAPMRWIDALTGCTDSTATATVRYDADHFAVSSGAVLETSLIECIAQTAAAALGQRSRASGKNDAARNGMLAAVSRFCIRSRPPLGKTLTIEIRELKRFGPMLLIAGTVACEGGIIASGELSLYA